ncbi:hypothetical protein XMD509_002384 [Marinobacterium sp. xm-d-509]|nr:hypothetical protein [Marinobacterium sp. xm-d-509]
MADHEHTNTKFLHERAEFGHEHVNETPFVEIGVVGLSVTYGDTDVIQHDEVTPTTRGKIADTFKKITSRSRTKVVV